MLAGNLSFRIILIDLKNKILMIYQDFISCKLELKIDTN
jgi:hypothetical protein